MNEIGKHGVYPVQKIHLKNSVTDSKSFIKEYDGHKYKITVYDKDDADFNIHENMVVAEARFAKKIYRGVAKCHPDDTFNLEDGINIAILRCAVKIADKRRKYACKELRQSFVEFKSVSQKHTKLVKYATSANEEYFKTSRDLEIYLTGDDKNTREEMSEECCNG